MTNMVPEGTAYFFVALALATGLLCGFVWGNLWAWWQEDKERRKEREGGLT